MGIAFTCRLSASLRDVRKKMELMPVNVDTMTDDELMDAVNANMRMLKLRQKLRDVSEAALLAAYKDLCFRTYKMAMENGEYDIIPTEYREMMRVKADEMMSERRRITDKRFGKATHFFVTINVMSEKATEDYALEFQSEVHKFLTTCKFTKNNYLYCIEQRSSEDEEPVHGLHAHVLVSKTAAPSEYYRAFFNRFLDTWCGNQKHCYFVNDDTHEKVYNHEQYIKGIKKDKKKMLKVEQDRKMRHRLGLKDYYHDDIYIFKTGVEEIFLTTE